MGIIDIKVHNSPVRSVFNIGVDKIRTEKKVREARYYSVIRPINF